MLIWKVRLLGRKTVVRYSDLLSQGLLMYRKAGIRIYDVNPLTDCRNRVSDGRAEGERVNHVIIRQPVFHVVPYRLDSILQAFVAKFFRLGKTSPLLTVHSSQAKNGLQVRAP